MLLTPRIVRTHELTQEDVSPIHIGTQQNLGLTGPPPLIAPQPEAGPEGNVETQPAAQEIPALPPAAPGPAQEVTSGFASVEGAPDTPPVSGIPEAPSSAQLLVTPPGSEFVVGEGPYTVPLTVNGASRFSGVTLTLRFDPAILRVRTVQEGSFMRQGGLTTTFSQQVDPASGRVDFSITRMNDATGASGSGLAAVVVFEAITSSNSPLESSGDATSPEGMTLPISFSSQFVTVPRVAPRCR